MGAADIIPGVSGGTMAMATGIYEDFIGALDSLKMCFRGRFKDVAWNFIIPLATGIAVSVILLSRPLAYLLRTRPGLTFAYFTGLIFITVISVFRMILPAKATLILPLLAGTASAYMLAGLTPYSGNNISLIYLFVSGLLAVCAMMLPGISGSFILLLLGVYAAVMSDISSLTALVTGGAGGDAKRLIPILFLFSGILTGLITVSGIVKKALQKHRVLTLSLLAGFMAGALRKPVTEIYVSGTPLWPCVLMIAAGIVSGYLIERTGISRRRGRPGGSR